jgi:RNA polymerase sigma-70 factor, ECF subfamily
VRYTGPRLPEPILTSQSIAEDPLEMVERREVLSLGALAMLERLTAHERAVLVLREALGLSHTETARAIGISEAGSRQLLARARRWIAGSAARTPPSYGVHQRLVIALIGAFQSGDLGSLAGILRVDVVAVTDGGARPWRHGGRSPESIGSSASSPVSGSRRRQTSRPSRGR